MALTMKSSVFRAVTLGSSESAQRLEGTYRLHVLFLISCSAYSSALKMDTIYSSETSDLLRSLRCYNSETDACSLLLLVSFAVDSSALKMEAIYSSEKLDFLKSSRRYNPEPDLCLLPSAGIWLCLLSDPEDGGDICLLNVRLSLDIIALHPEDRNLQCH
jgi:hypothetical protein